MSDTPQIKPPPPDNAVAGDIVFFADSHRFCIDGLKDLKNHLVRFEDVKKTFELERSEYDDLIEYISRMIDWAEEKLGSHTSRSHHIFEYGVRYGSLRLLKAGGFYRLHKREKQRDDLLAKHPDLPRALLASIDEKTAQLRDWLEQGVMNGLRPAEIFFEVTTQAGGQVSDQPKETLQTESASKASTPLYLEKIPIFDGELRARCLSLLSSLDYSIKGTETSEKGTQLDTVVREMSVILENRIRELAGLASESTEGQELMSRAFSGSNPPLRFSSDPAIQQSAHLLFRGYSGFVRNEVMHRLVHTFTSERVLQLLGLVDYLMFVLTQAEHFAGSETKPTESPESKNLSGK
jgi:hypothetical protein